MTEGMLELRDYQRACIEALAADWRAGTRRLAAVLPTGAGKTVIFAHLIRQVCAAGGRALVLVHRDELAGQALQKIHDVAPGLRTGLVKAERREIFGRDAVVASVQSLTREASRVPLRQAGFSLIIVDECHHATANTYMNIIRDLGGFEPDGVAGLAAGGALVVGFTATLQRGDGVALGDVWQKVSFRVDILDLIRRGYLVTARGVRVRVEGLDLRRVRRTGGDWEGKALGAAMSECLAPAAIARAYKEHSIDRQGIAFLPSVELAHEQAAVLCAEGIGALAVDGTTRPEDRREALAAFRRGDAQVLTNCGVFTEGTDLPMASAVVIARPTSSAPLYVQMAGRGLRPHPGKRDCLITDVVGVTGRHRIASLVTLAGGERVEDLTEAQRDELDELEAELGLDLLELDGRLDSSGTAVGPELIDGRLISEAVELFESSHQAWLRTHRGVWFVVAGKEVISLVPVGEARFSVAAMPLDSSGGRWVAEGVELSYAMSWGEQEAHRIEQKLPYGIGKKAGWRTKPISGKQRDMCGRMGVTVQDGWMMSDASDAISIEKASRRLDHLPMFMEVTR